MKYDECIRSVTEQDEYIQSGSGCNIIHNIETYDDAELSFENTPDTNYDESYLDLD